MIQGVCGVVPAGRPRSRSIYVLRPDDVRVDVYTPVLLGFSDADALVIKRGVAAVLTDLARGEWRPRLESSERRRLTDHLHLDEPTKEAVLDRLRDYGSGLFRGLSGDLRERLRRIGFPLQSGQQGPPLEFIELGAPLPWEFLYESEEEEGTDWECFWGFRVPLTHWQADNEASDCIEIHNGVFSVMCSTLCGSGSEVDSLVEAVNRIAPGLKHRDLEDALLELVAQQRGQPPRKHERWLADLLAGCDDLQREKYIREWLVKVLGHARSDHPLVHFACHGEVDSETELLSRLRFCVGGADLTLPLLWLSRLKVAAAGSPRGPLVFLNTCFSGQPSAGSFSFPKAWIDAGAAAVIATLCPIPDDFALLFAEEFYTRLLEGGANTPIAEVLLETRRHFMREFNNPLGLAYVLYALRGARVVPRRGRREAS